MEKTSSKQKILEYLRENLGEWVHNQKLREISGANDTPRTIRQLKQEGWQIEIDRKGNNRLISKEKGEPKGIRGGPSQKERYEVFHRDGFRCRACGRGVDEGAQLQTDHIIPVEWGGKSELSNYQSLCKECNAGKKAWVKGQPISTMKKIISLPSVEARIEALFDTFPNQDIPSTLIRDVSKAALDWQRALRRVRQKTRKNIKPTLGKTAYRYYKE